MKPYHVAGRHIGTACGDVGSGGGDCDDVDNNYHLHQTQI